MWSVEDSSHKLGRSMSIVTEEKSDCLVTPRRFEWVIQGKSLGPDPACDHDLWSHSRAAVVPSLGAIVPYWYLVVPRVRTLSFRQLRQGLRMELLELARGIGSRFAESLMPVYFEHGGATTDSSVSCSTDQAHLHLVMLNYDLINQVLAQNGDDRWIDADASDPWANIPGERDYYLVASGERAIWSTPSSPASQFFRKMIAEVAGVPDRWNYREWPHTDNVLIGRREFARLQREALASELKPARRTLLEIRPAAT